MKKNLLIILFSIGLTTLVSCSNDNDLDTISTENELTEDSNTLRQQIITSLEKIDKSTAGVFVIINNEFRAKYDSAFVMGFVTSRGDIVCRGYGTTFARCLEAALQSGVRLMVYMDAQSGEYFAEAM